MPREVVMSLDTPDTTDLLILPTPESSVEQVVYSIYHMVLYFLPEGDGWVGCW